MRSSVALVAAVLLATPVFGGDGIVPIGNGFYTVTNHPEAIVFLGKIDTTTMPSLSAAIMQHPKLTTLVLDSGGGDVFAAMLMGGTLRAFGVATVVPPNGVCFSACALVYLSGKNRVALGAFGVHQITTLTKNESDAQTAVGAIIGYLDQIGIPLELMTIMLQTPPDQIHVLTPDEQLRLDVNAGVVPFAVYLARDPYMTETTIMPMNDPTTTRSVRGFRDAPAGGNP